MSSIRARIFLVESLTVYSLFSVRSTRKKFRATRMLIKTRMPRNRRDAIATFLPTRMPLELISPLRADAHPGPAASRLPGLDGSDVQEQEEDDDRQVVDQ